MAITFTERYVDASASGGGTGTQASPWTFSEALTNASAGDRVNVKVGTYTGDNTVMTANGTRDNPIVFRGYQTTIGDLDDNNEDLSDGTEIPFISGNVSGGGFYNCYYTFVNHLSFKTTAIYNVYGWRMWLNYGYVRRCKFLSDASGQGSAATRACSVAGNTSVYDCYIRSTSSTSYSLVDGLALHSIGNTIAYTGSGFGGAGLAAQHSFNNTYVNLGNGISVAYATYNINVNNCTFYNCITGFKTNNADYDRTRTITNCYFANCVTGIDSYLTDNSGFNVINCGFYNNTNNVSGNVPLLVNPRYDYSDPFVDSANNDFRLASSSAGFGNAFPAINLLSVESNNRDIGAIQHADPAYVAPPDASATTKVFPFRSWVEGDFQQEGADADEFVEKHELQALPVFEFSIGTAAGRDYNSLTAFFAAFDNTLVDLPNSKVIVTCYNDTGADQWISDTSTVTVSCPTNCIDFVLTVDDDSWHKGQYGKGVTIKLNSYNQYVLVAGTMNNSRFLIERLSLDANNQFNTNTVVDSVVFVSSSASTNYIPIPENRLRDLYVRGGDGTAFSSRGAIGIYSPSRHVLIENCIVENIVCNGSATSYSGAGILVYFRSKVRNCTINNIDYSNSTSTNYGIYGGTDATYGLTENCVVTNVNGDCYLSTLTNTSNLVADDATGTIQSTAAGEFVDAANSDYKLKGTASAAGIVAATNAKVTDITGKLRKAGVAQDAGAFNNVAGYDDSPVFPPDQPTDPIIHPLRGN